VFKWFKPKIDEIFDDFDKTRETTASISDSLPCGIWGQVRPESTRLAIFENETGDEYVGLATSNCGAQCTLVPFS
jgi:hypothetical protein